MPRRSCIVNDRLKIVLVGDPEVGKTWLLSRAQELFATFCDDGYSLFKKPFAPPEAYSPTVFESYLTNVDTQHLGNYQTNIWDTGGWWIFNSVRPVSYVGAHVFMLCFDVTNRDSLYSITESWLPEVYKYQPGVPVLLVGTKGDLRAELESSSDGFKTLVSVSEANAVAEKLGTLYQETSAQDGDAVDKAFAAAVELGHSHRLSMGDDENRKRLTTANTTAWLPPISSPPTFKTEPPTFAKDFKKAMKDTTNADILFSFEDGSESIPAHKIVLWLSSSAFREVLRQKDINTFKKFKDIFDVKEMPGGSFQLGQNNNASVTEHSTTCIVLKNWISHETFIEILEFLYTGETGISMESEYDEIKKLLSAAEKLKVSALVDICNHFLKLKDNEKKSDAEKKVTGLAPKPPRPSVRDLFQDKKATPFCDVTFLVEGKLVFAHKAVLAARSQVLGAHLSENFKDGKNNQVHLHGVDSKSFLAVLEYLYTDHCSSLDKIPVENVLVLADRLCLPHLVQICEAEMHKGLREMIPTEIDIDAANDLLDLLSFSKMFNAKQLTEWCLYFLALNLTRFQGISKKLDLVVAENNTFFEKHNKTIEEYLQILEAKPKWLTKGRRQWHFKAKSCLPHKCSIM